MQSTIVVGTTDGLHQIGPERDKSLETHEVTWIAQAGSRWWAILDGRELWCSESQDSWKQIASLGSHRANCALPYDGGVLVGASDSHLHRLSGNVLGPVKSFDEAPGREYLVHAVGRPSRRAVDVGGPRWERLCKCPRRRGPSVRRRRRVVGADD